MNPVGNETAGVALTFQRNVSCALAQRLCIDMYASRAKVAQWSSLYAKRAVRSEREIIIAIG